MTNPCAPDCPDRSPTCHANCKAYLEYYAEQRKGDAERQAKHGGNSSIVNSRSYSRYIDKARKAPKRYLHKGR